MKVQFNFEPSLCDCGATIPHSVAYVALGLPVPIPRCPECAIRARFRDQRLLRLPIKQPTPRPREGSDAWHKLVEEVRKEFGYYEKEEQGDAEPKFE